MIETLSLRNFKVLREVDIALHPLTLIVGPNSSGKSTLLQALQLVAAKPDDALRRFAFNSEFFLSRKAQGPIT